MLQVGTKAPDFDADAVMADGQFGRVKLSDYLGKKYVLLFFYPFDFTFVCPSEIIAFDKLIKEFEARNVQVLGCSVDSKFTHFAWRETPVNKGGIGRINYPLLSDVSHYMTDFYCVSHPDGMATRGLFLIDKNGILQHILVNNLPIGRSVEEALRVVDALQYTEEHGEVCPANWKKGAKAMKPTVEGVADYLSKNA